MNVTEMDVAFAMLQTGIIAGIILLLAQIPGLKKIGVPATAMMFALFVGSILPKLMPELYQLIFPGKPIWPPLIKGFVVIVLGAFAGREIELKNIKQMGAPGIKFIGASMIAPIIFALPIAFALASFNNPFIQVDANFLGVVVGIVALVFMRALPTMIAFFKGNGWLNDLVKVSLCAASLDDLVVFVLLQPIIAGLMSGHGVVGIIHSLIAVIATAVVMWIASRIVRLAPTAAQQPLAYLCLFAGAGAAEIVGHIHFILSGILWGMMMPRPTSHEIEEKLKGFTLDLFVPTFFAGLGLTYKFDILSPAPWALGIVCLVVAYTAHQVITAPIGARIFGGSKEAGKVLGILCCTHGTADVLLAISLFEMGILTSTGLSGMMLFLLLSTINAFFRAQSLVDRSPELAAARIDTSRPTTRGQTALAFGDPNEEQDS